MSENRQDRYSYGLVLTFVAWVVICGVLIY